MGSDVLGVGGGYLNDTPESHPQAGWQFLDGEGLGQIIVGTCAKSIDFVHIFAMGTEDNNWDF